MTEELRRQARDMMQRDSETAGFGRATPAPTVSIPHTTPEPLDKDHAELCVSMTFMSRTEGARPHVVSVDYDGFVRCICRATSPCHAVKAFCMATGRPVYH